MSLGQKQFVISKISAPLGLGPDPQVTLSYFYAASVITELLQASPWSGSFSLFPLSILLLRNSCL